MMKHMLISIFALILMSYSPITGGDETIGVGGSEETIQYGANNTNNPLDESTNRNLAPPTGLTTTDGEERQPNKALNWGEGEKAFGSAASQVNTIHKTAKKGLRDAPIIPPPPFKAPERPLADTGPVSFMGSPLFMKCQRQSPKRWSELVQTIPVTGNESSAEEPTEGGEAMPAVTAAPVEPGQVDERFEGPGINLLESFKFILKIYN